MNIARPLVALIFLGGHATSTSPVQSSCLVYETTLLDPGGVPSEGLGRSVALGGNSMISGAPDGTFQNQLTGKALVHVRVNDAWSYQAVLTGTDSNGQDGFGRSVDIDGDIAVVGAHRHTHSLLREGAVYVFERSGSVWTQTAEIIAPDTSAFAAFGSAVALSGNTLMIGAPSRRNNNDFATGRVYFFERIGSNWVFQFAHSTSTIPWQGTSVDVSGDWAIAGAPEDSGPFPIQGSAAIYQRSGNVWSMVQGLSPAFNNSWDYFGASVSISDNVAVVGASQAYTGGTYHGEVHIYQRVGQNWNTWDVISPANGQSFSRFGGSVSLEGGRILVGAAEYDGLGPGSRSGRAYLLELNGGTWTEASELIDPTASSFDAMGSSVALGGGHAVMGAPGRNYQAPSGGALVLFKDSSPTTSYCTAKVNSQGCTPSTQWSGDASASSNLPFVVEATQLINNTNGLFFYGLNGRSSAPFQGGTLCVQGPFFRTGVRSTGGNGGVTDCSGTLAVNFNDVIQSGANPGLVPGTLVHGQFYYRDLQSSFFVGLSDGVEFQICP